MRINVASLLGQKGASLKVQEKLPCDFVNSVPAVKRALSPIQAEITITNTGQGFLVGGEVEFAAALQCSRCLKPFNTKLRASFQEEYRSRPRFEPGESSRDFWEEEEPPLAGNELDLTDLIEESVFMSIPMKTVCDPSCPGLCPVCGGVLAEQSCACLSPETDLRLAPLSKLLQFPERRKENGSTKEKTLQSEN